MNVLVTGATGFLGKFLTKKLEEEKINVVALGSKHADLRDPSALNQYNDRKFDRIFHLAAWTQAGDFCVYHPGEQWLINQQINTTVLNWWLKSQSQAKLVSIGTSCAYDETIAHTEENYLLGTPREELFTYGMTKRMLLIGQRALHTQYGLSYLTVVPSTLHGPHYGLMDKQVHFIFDLIRKIINYREKNEKIILWGDGLQRRELVFINDFVDILLMLLERENNELVNVGAGIDFSIKEFAEMICKILDVDPYVIEFDETKYVGARSKILDNRKLMRLLPNCAQEPIEKALKTTIDWVYQDMHCKLDDVGDT